MVDEKRMKRNISPQLPNPQTIPTRNNTIENQKL